MKLNIYIFFFKIKAIIKGMHKIKRSYKDKYCILKVHWFVWMLSVAYQFINEIQWEWGYFKGEKFHLNSLNLFKQVYKKIIAYYYTKARAVSRVIDVSAFPD